MLVQELEDQRTKILLLRFKVEAVPGAFDNARWDYDYYLKTQRLHNPGRGHVAIFFTNDLVARVDSDVTQAPFAPISVRGANAPEPRAAGGH